MLFLASAGMIWDAEIILRAYCETTVRLLNICLSPAGSTSARLGEFLGDAGAIGERRRAVRSTRLRDVPGSDPRAAAMVDVFSDPALYAVEPRADKRTRGAVEQAWSFSELVRTLAGSGRGPASLPQLENYLHIYGIASHLLHADPTALALMHDRATRPPSELALLEAAQMCRIFTDVVGLSYICADGVRSLIGGEFAEPQKLSAFIERCLALTRPVFNAFCDSQAEFFRADGRSEF